MVGLWDDVGWLGDADWLVAGSGVVDWLKRRSVGFGRGDTFRSSFF